MGNKRHKPEEIVTNLGQVEVLVGQGMARIDAIRQVRITNDPHWSFTFTAFSQWHIGKP